MSRRTRSAAATAAPASAPRKLRCAIYTRKSTEEGLDQAFNSLDAQREAGLAYIKSQASEGWTALPDRYDDGGVSGGTLERPALRRLLHDVEAGLVDVVSRSFLLDVPPPLAPVTRNVVRGVFERHLARADEGVSDADRTTLGRLLDDDDPRSVVRRPDVFVLSVRTVHAGTVAG